MPSELDDRLALLPRMNKAQLLDLWKQLFRLAPPHQCRRGLIIKFLAHRIQEQAYGRLSPAARKRLSELARKFETNPKAKLSTASPIKPGTRLIRDWRGRSHRVTVLENGYEYAGKRYSSLSQIARSITGTRWSGPLFFGLRGKEAKETMSAQRS
ncbi:MAG: DUF2924 domain-containing protein [Acidipila sp.]|nr:DUF2924 domain-containing protein [Acidipila sp.]